MYLNAMPEMLGRASSLPSRVSVSSSGERNFGWDFNSPRLRVPASPSLPHPVRSSFDSMSAPQTSKPKVEQIHQINKIAH